jgi:hypothetical protein
MEQGHKVIDCKDQNHFAQCFILLSEQGYNPYSNKEQTVIYVRKNSMAWDARQTLKEVGLA